MSRRDKRLEAFLADDGGAADKAEIARLRSLIAEQAVELERMREALEQIADGSAPPIPHGHYLAHRHAVDLARVALPVKAG